MSPQYGAGLPAGFCRVPNARRSAGRPDSIGPRLLQDTRPFPPMRYASGTPTTPSARNAARDVSRTTGYCAPDRASQVRSRSSEPSSALSATTRTPSGASSRCSRLNVATSARQLRHQEANTATSVGCAPVPNRIVSPRSDRNANAGTRGADCALASVPAISCAPAFPIPRVVCALAVCPNAQRQQNSPPTTVRTSASRRPCWWYPSVARPVPLRARRWAWYGQESNRSSRSSSPRTSAHRSGQSSWGPD